MERRGFFAGILGLFGVASTSKASEINTNDTLLKVKINVGSLPTLKAEAFIEKVGKRIREKLPDSCQMILTPVRDEASEVTFHFKKGESYELADQVFVDFSIKDEFGPQEVESHKQECTDYALLLLGAPVITIELDQQQLDFCFKEAQNRILNAHYNANGITALCERHIDLLKQGVYTYASVMLAHIRNKYYKDLSRTLLDSAETPLPLGFPKRSEIPELITSAANQLTEANERMREWHEELEYL